MSEPDNQVETEVLNEKQGSIIMGIIAQLRKGSDLSRVTLPTFVLESRSMLERVTDFMSHPNLIMQTHKKNDPLSRFIDVVRYFLSGWHIKPQGVKKPYNPVLGELFRCQWKFNDNTRAFYLAEQVTHHPPISAYIYTSPENNLLITGEIRPISKFLGNSAATIMEGGCDIQFIGRDELYSVGMPNVYARGILFGSMFMELGDSTVVKCKESDLVCELDFKIKGFFGGSYNGIAGKIKKISTGEQTHTISGNWDEKIFIQAANSKEKTVLFDVAQESVQAKIITPESEQEEFESRNLWKKVTAGMISRNLDQATLEKTTIEENQRALKQERINRNIDWKPRFFELNENDEWQLIQDIPVDPKLAIDVIEKVLFAKSQEELYSKFWVKEDSNS